MILSEAQISEIESYANDLGNNFDVDAALSDIAGAGTDLSQLNSVGAYLQIGFGPPVGLGSGSVTIVYLVDPNDRTQTQTYVTLEGAVGPIASVTGIPSPGVIGYQGAYDDYSGWFLGVEGTAGVTTQASWSPSTGDWAILVGGAASVSAQANASYTWTLEEILYGNQEMPPIEFMVPAGIGSARLQGVNGLIPTGHEANALDALAEVLYNSRSCFLPGTPILLADGTTKPIEEIELGDMVATYDANGDLLAKPVTNTFTNDVTQILDVFGLKVTPGHVTLCGDGAFDGQHVPIIDIIRTDGSLVRADGSKMRVNTGCDLGSRGDLMIDVICGQHDADGAFQITDEGKLRAGTRMILENGTDVSILELIEAAGGALSDDGQLIQDGEAVPFLWPAGPKLPRPEDYLLKRSKATLTGIYEAAEWDGVQPQVRHWS